VSHLNKLGINEIIAVDNFTPNKVNNLSGKKIAVKIDRGHFFEKVKPYLPNIDFIFHLGAKTNTLESSEDLFEKWNTDYSKKIWSLCVENQISLIYASSAATYGNGELGFSEDEAIISKLRPLNNYARSKNKFDLWIISQKEYPPYWAGLKFFNVFGPNEYHKGPMASMIYQAFNQIQKNSHVRLFKSYRSGYDDGGQKRDFIYALDVAEICTQLMQHHTPDGIINIGTGHSISFNDVVKCIFEELNLSTHIEYIDMPSVIQANYQYSTQADLAKLELLPGTKKCIRLPQLVIKDYLSNYLIPNKLYY